MRIQIKREKERVCSERERERAHKGRKTRLRANWREMDYERKRDKGNKKMRKAEDVKTKSVAVKKKELGK